MTRACGAPVPGPGEPTTALAAALELVVRGIEQLRAAVEVEWEAPAAELYRAEVAEAALAVARDLLLLKDVVQRAEALRAAGGLG
ncbi:hypothetical protein [Promicromonospora iranensis]|uniref:Uncharacterized protein n=1 Tax=Promicromonospora iranensis TaxID=1105144 RepID=A0ABU2CQ48_9MICO|nr:hypothetical protein [Promicromonospora iranensis]MDR7383468.1 hypothetical protein [Promicromonospora iranensis]